MPVFNGTVKTPTAVTNSSTDHLLPPAGALSYGAITSSTALSGTTGVNCCRVSGDTWDELLGNLTEHVLLNRKMTVDQNQTCVVKQNAFNTVIGKTFDTHISNHQQVNVAPRTDIFNHTRTEIHAQPENVKQPTEKNEHTETEHAESYKVVEIKKNFIEIADSAVDLVALLDVGISNRSMDLAFVTAEGASFKHEIHGIRNELGAMKNDVKAMKVKAALTHAKAIAANLNAGLAANADSPMA